MIFVKTFKGYEDKIGTLDSAVNTWVQDHKVDVVDIKAVLSHEHEARARSGDLIYTLTYRAEKAIPNDHNGPGLG